MLLDEVSQTALLAEHCCLELQCKPDASVFPTSMSGAWHRATAAMPKHLAESMLIAAGSYAPLGGQPPPPPPPGPPPGLPHGLTLGTTPLPPPRLQSLRGTDSARRGRGGRSGSSQHPARGAPPANRPSQASTGRQQGPQTLPAGITPGQQQSGRPALPDPGTLGQQGASSASAQPKELQQQQRVLQRSAAGTDAGALSPGRHSGAASKHDSPTRRQEASATGGSLLVPASSLSRRDVPLLVCIAGPIPAVFAVLSPLQLQLT